MKMTRIMAIAALIARSRPDASRGSGSGKWEPGASISSDTISASPDARSFRRSSSCAGNDGSEAHASGRRDHLCPRRHVGIQVEGKPPVTLKAGEVLFIPAGTIHSARNIGTGRAAELATYIVEKGKPLVTVVK